MKFKVGDKIKILTKQLQHINCCLNGGEVFTIKRITPERVWVVPEVWTISIDHPQRMSGCGAYYIENEYLTPEHIYPLYVEEVL